MQMKTRMNVYFEPGLLKQVEALALRRNVSKSAVIEAAVASFLSADASERLEAVFARRMDKLGRQVDGLDEDLAILGEAVSLFIRFWLTVTPPLAENAQASARAKGAERFEGFMQSLGRIASLRHGRRSRRMMRPRPIAAVSSLWPHGLRY